jgi:TM2 domain-containing membrane protein YozV
MNKYLITIFVLIVFVIISGIGVVLFYNNPSYTEQPDILKQPETITQDIDATHWVTYSSDKFGYYLRLPPEFVLADEYSGEYKIFNSEDNTFEFRNKSSKYNDEYWKNEPQITFKVSLIGLDDGPESIEQYIDEYETKSNKKISKLYTSDDGITYYKSNDTQGDYISIIRYYGVIISLSFTGVDEIYFNKIIDLINFKTTPPLNPETNEPTYDLLYQTCPYDILGERHNRYKAYIENEYNLNGCIYGVDTKELLNPDYWSERTGCEEFLGDELANNEYNLINGCLYKGKENIKIFNWTIHSMAKAGDFGEQYSLTSTDRWGIGETASEWFRFEDEGILYIFFKGAAGCGGCIFNGPYLKINLSNGEIVKSSAEIPYIPYLISSPDLKKAIEVEFDQDYDEQKGDMVNNINLYKYDFISLKRSPLILKVPEGKSIIQCGHGCYIPEGAIEWLDNQTIKVQPMEHNGFGNVINLTDEKSGKILWDQYLPDGESIMVSIN